MRATALLPVLVSAGCHAYRNLLLERAGGSHEFVAASEAVIFLPAFAALVLRAPAGTFDGAGRAVLGYVAVGTALVLAPGTVWDKFAVRAVPLAYVYGCTAAVVLGARFLGERVAAPRRLGVGLVPAGALPMASGR